MQVTPFGRIEIPLEDLPVAFVAPQVRKEFPPRLARETKRTVEEPAEPTVAGPAPVQQPPAPEPRSRAKQQPGPTAAPRSAAPTAPIEAAAGQASGGEPAAAPERRADVTPQTRLPETPATQVAKAPLPVAAAAPAQAAPPATPTTAAAPAVQSAARTQATASIGARRGTRSVLPLAEPAQGSRMSRRMLELAQEQRDATIGRIALAASKQGGEMRAWLDPPELGSVAIRMQLDGDALRVQLSAERREVALVLMDSEHELGRALADAGIDLRDLDVGTGSREQHARDLLESQRGAPGSTGLAIGTPRASEQDNEASGRVRIHDGDIDCFA